MAVYDANLNFYATHYDVLGNWLLRPGTKVMLGDKTNRVCRFCDKKPPEVNFGMVAHAIPEALGNKSIETAYECDTCNQAFGAGIENDLGNWSKPMRTFARIRGKRGVPTLKKGGNSPGWRIEYESSFVISSYEADPFYKVDEEGRTVTFTLKRDPYTPVAVLKAFMKIGLSLLPHDEVKNFLHLRAWVREPSHSLIFAEKCPVIYTFQPGPMPNDLIAALILRRKPGTPNYPYAYLVLGYGNEMYQVQLPSRDYDESMNGRSLLIPPFPHPGSPDPARYGQSRCGLLDFTGRQQVRGETFILVTGFESSSRIAPMLHRERRIRERAYFIWLDEGCPPGKDLDHWLQAERELGAVR